MGAIVVLDTARWRPPGIAGTVPDAPAARPIASADAGTRRSGWTRLVPAHRRTRSGCVRIIARLNIGGPAIQAITLTRRMTERGYETTLVRGREEPDEGNMDYLARELGVQPVLVPWMRRNPGWRDVPALIALIRILRRERPQIVHTHAAKGGTLGRVAALIAFPRRRARPVLVHTYHGHSLTGYFSGRTASVFRRIERLLAPLTDVLIAVSDEVRDELVALGVAPAERFDGRAARLRPRAVPRGRGRASGAPQRRCVGSSGSRTTRRWSR